MFTGIIEEIGEIKKFSYMDSGAIVEVGCNKVLEDTKIGDSISINGVCETVTKLTNSSFFAKISDETLKVTTFNNLKQGVNVNLERALTLNSRLGGHIVSGHVDCIGKILSIENHSEFYDIEIEFPEIQSKYFVYKGSVTVDGISLTVADVTENTFRVAVIPHTYENTALKYLKSDDFVNIETDILGKYVEKMLSSRDNKSNISFEMLQENGFV
ncbi:riboflavin synthase [bacterium]|nr:riboflavin synthase [bacterium]